MKALETFELWNRRAIACIALIRLAGIGIQMLLHCEEEAEPQVAVVADVTPLKIFELDIHLRPLFRHILNFSEQLVDFRTFLAL
jgi:hypothetical protein